jgi:hypothetical protein
MKARSHSATMAKHPPRLSPVLDGLRTPILATGMILVGIGAVMLIYLGLMVIKVLNTPEEIRIVQFIQENTSVGDQLFSGHVGEQDIEISLSEPVRTVLFLVLGVSIFGVLAGILKALISGGIELIRLASSPREEKSARDPRNQSYHDMAP